MYLEVWPSPYKISPIMSLMVQRVSPRLVDVSVVCSRNTCSRGYVRAGANMPAMTILAYMALQHLHAESSLMLSLQCGVEKDYTS